MDAKGRNSQNKYIEIYQGEGEGRERVLNKIHELIFKKNKKNTKKEMEERKKKREETVGV